MLDSRMEIVGRAASFVDNIDKKANALAAQTEQEIGRMADRVNEINRFQAVVQSIADVTSTKFDQVIGDFRTFTDEARAEISTGGVTNREAMAKAEEARTSVNEFFEKCRVAYDMHEKSLNELKATFTTEANDLRQGVYKWSAEYVQEINLMVQTGGLPTGFDQRPGASTTKHDKKDLSVWKIPDNGSKS